MTALRDDVPQTVNSIDFEVHSNRGQRWFKSEKEEFNRRILHAETLLRNDEPNNVFVIAKVCKLSVLTVRDLKRGLK